MRGKPHYINKEKQDGKPPETETRTKGLIAYQEGGEKGLDEFLTRQWAEKPITKATDAEKKTT